MANYPTSSRQPKGRHRRYTVTYEEDCTGGYTLTFGVDAHSLSEATSKTIDFIDRHHLHHDKDHGYFLTPKLSKQKTDYNIPYKTNPEI